MKVDRYVEPSEFDSWKKVAEDMGFLYVASGPLVRSSYKVSEQFQLSFSSADDGGLRLVNFTLKTFSEEKQGKRDPGLLHKMAFRQTLQQ
jgi:hypothetical protein